MALYTKRHLLLVSVFLLLATGLLSSCGQGSSGSAATPTPTATATPTVTPTPQPTVCASCFSIGQPSLSKLGPVNGSLAYQLTFLITNSGTADLTNFEVDLKVEAQTATSTTSSSQTLSNSGIVVPGHGQYTYKVGDSSSPSSGILLPDPPPATAHITISIMVNSTTVANWDGQVDVPA